MLTHLTISQLIIIDHLDIEFKPKLTVITGETGAGKSILLDALNLALGERATGQLVRPGAERADISAQFSVTHIPAAKTWLAEHELDEEDTCILRRTITQDGRSRSYINGHPVTLHQLRAVGRLLLTLHSQHSAQGLLQREEQQRMLDTYAQHLTLVEQVKQLHAQWQKAQDRLTELEQSVAHKNQQQQTLAADLEELTELQLVPKEAETLAVEQQRLANAHQLLTQGQAALHLISESAEANADHLLNQAIQQLHTFERTDKDLHAIIELLSQALIHIHEAKSSLEHYLAQIEINPERLSWVEERLAALDRVARKHRVKTENLLELQQELTQRYQQLDSLDTQLQKARLTLEKAEQDYLTAARHLSFQRQAAAEQLAQAITARLAQLNFQRARCQIQLLPHKHNHSSGLEQVEFQLQTNPGQPLQPLNQIASGGELSRVNLAIQAITAQKEATPTLLFDEVDVGIGGQTATIVGRQLQQLAQKTQVICITHLPQVAAYGDHHLKINKHSTEDTTTLSLEVLTKETRITELARMLGGLHITQQTLAHAEEMLKHPAHTSVEE